MAMDIIPLSGYGIYHARQIVFILSRIAAKLWQKKCTPQSHRSRRAATLSHYPPWAEI